MDFMKATALPSGRHGGRRRDRRCRRHPRRQPPGLLTRRITRRRRPRRSIATAGRGAARRRFRIAGGITPPRAGVVAGSYGRFIGRRGGGSKGPPLFCGATSGGDAAGYVGRNSAAYCAIRTRKRRFAQLNFSPAALASARLLAISRRIRSVELAGRQPGTAHALSGKASP